MNKKLKPWFIAGAVCAVIEILVFLILFSGDGLSGMLVFGFFILSPVQAAVCIQFWCVVGYIGTAREIKKDRPGALPVLLWIYTAVVLAVILISWTGYHPNSFMGGLTGIVPSLMTLYCGIPDAGFLIWCIVLTVIRAKKSYDFHAHYDGSPCYEKHGKAFTAAFVGISLTPVLLLAFCAASDGITQLRQEWENTEERQAARACLESADVIIDYQNTGDYSGGIMGTSLHRNSAVINYSEKRVTFIYMMSGSRMESYLFEEKDVPYGYKIQFRYPLDAPGKTFTTYYGKDTSVTIGASLEMRDGTVLYADIESRRLGFGTTPTPVIARALEMADEAVAIKDNSAEDGSLYPPYCMGIERDTVFIDYDYMKLFFIYCSGGRTWEDIGFTSGYGEAFAYELDFELYEGDMLKDIGGTAIVAYIPLHDPESALYVTWESTDANIFLRKDGKYYRAETEGVLVRNVFSECNYAISETESMRFVYPEYFPEYCDPEHSYDAIILAQKDEDGDWGYAVMPYTEGMQSLTSPELRFVSAKEAALILNTYENWEKLRLGLVYDDGSLEAPDRYSGAEIVEDIEKHIAYIKE